MIRPGRRSRWARRFRARPTSDFSTYERFSLHARAYTRPQYRLSRNHVLKFVRNASRQSGTPQPRSGPPKRSSGHNKALQACFSTTPGEARCRALRRVHAAANHGDARPAAGPRSAESNRKPDCSIIFRFTFSLPPAEAGRGQRATRPIRRRRWRGGETIPYSRVTDQSPRRRKVPRRRTSGGTRASVGTAPANESSRTSRRAGAARTSKTEPRSARSPAPRASASTRITRRRDSGHDGTVHTSTAKEARAPPKHAPSAGERLGATA